MKLLNPIFHIATKAWLLPAVLLLCSGLLAQPANDNCATASVINIGNGGYGLGTFDGAQTDMTNATLQSGETFAPGILTAGLSKKSAWYRFTLPTTRTAEVFLKQPSVLIADGNVGFAVYKATTCLPGDAQISTKLTPIAKFASSKHPCLEAGEYYIQVSANSNANGPIFISLQLSEPDPAPYDKPATASKFGKLAVNFTTTLEYAVGCQSIDNSAEVCLSNTSFANYTQSTWHTFSTPDYSDYIALIISGNGSNPSDLSKTRIGFRLFEGDITTTPLASLAQIGGCDSLNYQNNGGDFRLYKCGTFKPNTTYTVQFLYPTSFTNAFRFYVRQGGTAPTRAPQPLTTISATNKLGVLPSSYAGIATNAPMDVFACNARHSNYNCPKAMPVAGVPAPYNSDLRFNLSAFYSFTLANTANVKLTATGGIIEGPYLRLYQQGLVNTCADLDTSKIIGQGDNVNIDCLAPGDYVVQVMSRDSFLNAGLLVGNLGTNAGFQIIVSTIPAINKFSLNAPGAFEKINANGAGILQPLEVNKIYSTTPDTLGCANTVLPDVNCGVGDQKASYRQFLVGDSSIFRMEDGPRNWNFTSLYKGDANALAISQNAFSFPKLINGLVPMRTCMNYYDFVRETATCITPGTFSLVGFGPLNVGYINNFNVTIQEPRFSVIAPKAKHITPQTAQNMGDLWVQLGPGGGQLSSDLDTFSCYDNPAIIDGLDGCIRGPYKATKLIYRQFYLSQPSSIRIATGPHATYPRYGVLTLFSGKATDGLNGLKAVGGNWECFSDVSNAGSCTDLMPAGWYTVVAYGHGGTYQDPFQANNVAGGSCVGQPSSFYVWLYPQTCASPKFNRPHKASVDTITKKPFVVDWAPRTGHTAAYPATYQTYTLNKENFDCTEDTAFIKQHMGACFANNVKVAFYVFQITKESYLKIGGLPQDGSVWSRVYAFDVRTADSSKLKTDASLQPCMNKPTAIEFCKLQPGFYTLVVMAPTNYTCNAIVPTVYVDQVGFSRFDHANKAYDFGTLKPDSVWYNGKIGDVNPLNISRAPSNDFFYCTTGAQEKDPNAANCYFTYNPNIYPTANNKVLNPDYTKATTEPYINRRNLWYTFSINQPGLVRVRVSLPTPGKDIIGGYSIYKSDVDGTLPFSSVVAGGMVDSTALQGLTLVANSFGGSPCFGIDYPRPSPEVAFYVNPCDFKPTRYYIILDNSNSAFWVGADAMRPNYQVEVSVLLSNVPFTPTKFDHYSQANDLGIVNSGKKKGAVDNFTCATKDPPDPIDGNSIWDGGASCKKTLWYKFTTTVTGTIRYAAFFEIKYEYFYNHIQLFRQIKPNDSTSIGLQHLPYTSTHSFNGNWAQQCISPGTYYILLPGCNASTQDVYPEIEIIPAAGDYCSNPMIANLNGVDSKVVPVTIDCHTIGTDYGEFNQTLTCPANALTKNYKTSWYRLDIGGVDTLDLTVFINEKTNAGSADVKYRMMTGSCGAMQEQSCVQDALTRNTYECMIPGKSYYLQVFTPLVTNGSVPVVGDIDLNIAAVKHIGVCAPAINCIAVAEFTPKFDCTKDRNMSVTNLSTFGSDIRYDWDFGFNNAKSNAVSPEFFYPALTTDKIYTIKLVVTNLVCGKKDSISKTINIPARPSVNLGNDTIICTNPALLRLDATSHAGTKYQWYYWRTFEWVPYNTAATVDVANPNRIYVELTYNNCTARDTVSLWINPIVKKPLQTAALCQADKVTFDAWRGQGETYQWNNGSSLREFTATQPGYYWCDIYINGCTTRDSFLVVNPTATQQVKKVNTCQATLPYLADATVSGATGYKWIDNSTNAKLSITKAGLYWVDITLSGCTYRDTFNIAMDSFKTASLSARICGGQQYTLPSGKKVGITGVYSDSIKNVRGCDSLITTVTLTVDTVKRVSNSVFICAGQSFTLPSGKMISTAGLYQDTVRYKVSNCDSLVSSVTLTVAVVNRETQAATICAGITYMLPSGKVVSAAGQYIDTLKAKAGCDSLITTTNLTILTPIINTANASVCFGKTYTLPSGRVVSTSGLYRDTVRYVNGCDSLISNITVSVGNAIIDSKKAYVCEGNNYTLPSGRIVSTTGIYKDTVRSVQGCDSLISTIDLTRQTVTKLSNSASICGGQQFNLPSGRIVTTTGIYQDTLRYNTGCDSVINTIDLRVYNLTTNTNSVSVCFGKTYTLPSGRVISTSGLYRDTIRYVNGCDSLISNITVSVGNAIIESKKAYVCEGSNYTLPSGRMVNTTGIYKDTVRSAQGCDSLISTIDLTRQTATRRSNTAFICQGQTYTLPSGRIVTTTSVYQDTLRYTTGCDSVVSTINLTVYNKITNTNSVSVCFGKTYTLPSGRVISTSGLYRDTIRYTNGCDSLISNITVSVGNAIIESKKAYVCEGSNYTLPSGRIVSNTGIYKDTVRSVQGCDSLISTIDLTRQTVTIRSNTAFICQGQQYTLPSGLSINTSGIYQDTLRYTTGCDSVVSTIDLTVYNKITNTNSVSVCFGKTYTLPSGRIVSTSGLYRDTIRYVNSCDSLISNITVSVGNAIIESKKAFVCEGYNYTLPSGRIVNTTGIYKDTVRSVQGCDSLISTIDLTRQTVARRSNTAFICQGQQYTLPSGRNISTSGIYQDTLRYTTGCDSVVSTINLTVYNKITNTASASVCAGQTYRLPSGRVVNTSGLYRDTIRYINGCDSLVSNFTLTVGQPVRESKTATICQGDNYTLPSGRRIGVAGTYSDTLRTAQGCDSLITTATLNVDVPQKQTINTSICNNSRYTSPSGKVWTTAGTYADTLPNIRGCDSVQYSITLSIIPVSRQSITATICTGQQYTLPGGRQVSIAGIYIDTLQSRAGCDSIVTTTLQVKAPLSVSLQSRTSICLGDTAMIKAIATGGTGGPYTYTWTGTTGTGNTNIVIVTPNTPTATYSLTVSDGCSSPAATTATTIQTIPPPRPGLNNATQTICRGAGITLQATGGATYRWSPTAGLSTTTIANPTASPTTDTRYKVVVTTAEGCTGEDSILVKVTQPFTLTTSRDTVVCIGGSVQLSASGAQRFQWAGAGISGGTTNASIMVRPGSTTTYTLTGFGFDQCFEQTKQITVTVIPLPQVEAGNDTTVMVGSNITLSPRYTNDVTTYRWTPATYLTCTDCATPQATPRAQTTYTVTVRNQYQCEASDTRTIKLLCNSESVFVPNTFTPNGDGMNDVWYPRGAGIRQVKFLRVFNRWGQLIFERLNFNTDDRSAGWDGTYKGQLLSPDVYVYTIGLVCDNEEKLESKGNVMVVR